MLCVEMHTYQHSPNATGPDSSSVKTEVGTTSVSSQEFACYAELMQRKIAELGAVVTLRTYAPLANNLLYLARLLSAGIDNRYIGLRYRNLH